MYRFSLRHGRESDSVTISLTSRIIKTTIKTIVLKNKENYVYLRPVIFYVRQYSHYRIYNDDQNNIRFNKRHLPRVVIYESGKINTSDVLITCY